MKPLRIEHRDIDLYEEYRIVVSNRFFRHRPNAISFFVSVKRKMNRYEDA